MLGYILHRLWSSVPVLLLVSLLAFLLMQVVPGDPAAAIAGNDASAEELEAIRQTLGLDRVWYLRLVDWYVNLAHGDLGRSYVLGMSVNDAIMERLPVTLSLTMYSFAITIPLALLAGVVTAYWRGGIVDLAVTGVALLGVSLPNFWIGLMGILLFSVQLGWLPSGGYVPLTEDPLGWLRSLTMPAIVLGTFQIGLLTRITRSSMLDVLNQDYVRTARAKGGSELQVLIQHALRNALIPIITVIGVMFSLIVTGTVVTEQVFSIPGLGRLLVQGILTRDYPLIQGTLLFVAFIYVFINLLVDIAYAYVDPRIRYS